MEVEIWDVLKSMKGDKATAVMDFQSSSFQGVAL